MKEEASIYQPIDIEKKINVERFNPNDAENSDLLDNSLVEIMQTLFCLNSMLSRVRSLKVD